jgi:hypothetical protein
MDETDTTKDKPINWLRFMARSLSLMWAGWWTFFGLASGIHEGLSPCGVLIHTTKPGLIFLVSAAFAFCRPMSGGILLIVEGIFIMVAYPLIVRDTSPILTISFILVTMALPALLAGFLFILSHYASQGPCYRTDD